MILYSISSVTNKDLHHLLVLSMPLFCFIFQILGAVNPFAAKKSKKLPEKVLPELSDSDSNVPKKNPVKEDDLITKEPEKEPEVETSKPDKVHFRYHSYIT